MSCDCMWRLEFSHFLCRNCRMPMEHYMEALSTACARTVVAEDKELFLGEISISYLSGTPINVSSCLHC